MTTTLFTPSAETAVQFVDWVVDFDRVGRRTEVYDDEGLAYFVNDYWTARQRQGNRIHEISYRACFKPQLPEFFIDALTSPGDVVYDPFMGRGTTPIQAALMNRVPMGNDINPLSKMLTRPRLNPPELDEVTERLEEIDFSDGRVEDDELLVFYHPDTLASICSLRSWLVSRSQEGTFDHVDDWIRMVAINRLTGHSPGFFSVYTLPPNQATGVENQRKINQRRRQVPPFRDVKGIIIKKSRSLLSHRPSSSLFEPILGSSPASDTPYINDQSVDLIVTSPPFLDIVQYSADNWLRCWFAGIDSDSVPISMHRTPESWTQFVRDSFVEFSRILKLGGFVAFEVGEVRNGKVLLEHHVANAVVGLPFDLVGVLVNDQKFTKTSNTWGISNNNRGTNTNRVVILERH